MCGWERTVTTGKPLENCGRGKTCQETLGGIRGRPGCTARLASTVKPGRAARAPAPPRLSAHTLGPWRPPRQTLPVPSPPPDLLSKVKRATAAPGRPLIGRPPRLRQQSAEVHRAREALTLLGSTPHSQAQCIAVHPATTDATRARAVRRPRCTAHAEALTPARGSIFYFAIVQLRPDADRGGGMGPGPRERPVCCRVMPNIPQYPCAPLSSPLFKSWEPHTP
jgi:hypothetical protein